MSAIPPGQFRRRQTAHSVASNSSDKQPPPTKSAKPITLAKRLLFPNLPPEDDPPALLLSQALPPELNKELYDFIAVALRAYVHTWWTRITRYDKEFLPAITRVLTAVIRTIEARLIRTDLSPLILCDIPTLLTQHAVDYRNAKSKLHSSYAAGGAATLPQLFHQMQPHMALSADGKVEEAYVRQMVDEILRVCLPAEDYDPESERYIIREIILKVLLDGVIPRITQPWFIHQSILNLLGPEKNSQTISDSAYSAADASAARPPLPRRSSHTFSFQSLAIFFFSTVQAISGACLALIHAYKQAIGTIKKVNQSFPLHASSAKESPKPAETIPGSLVPLSPVPPKAIVVTPSSPSSPPSPPPSPPRPKHSRASSSNSSIPSITLIPIPPPSPPMTPPPSDYISPSLYLAGTLLSSEPRSMPLALVHVLNLVLFPFSALLSRLLPHLLYTHALAPDTLIGVLRAAKGALFPGGWPAVPPPDPTPEEQATLRKETVRRLLALVPGPLHPLLGSSLAAREQTVDEVLDPLSSQECNAHLIVFILDLVLITIFPEMGVSDSVAVVTGEVATTPSGSFNSVQSLLGDLTPPRPDSRPP